MWQHRRVNGPRAWRLALIGALVVPALWVAPARATDQNVTIVDFAFQPADVTISLNDRVIWTNNSQSSHTVTSDARAFDSGQLVSRQQYVLTFQRAGDFPYFCRFHPQQMRGVVHVRGGGGPTPTTVPGAPGATTTTRPGTPVPTTTLTTISNTTSSFLLPTTSSTSTSTTVAPFDTTPPQASSSNTGDDDDDDTTRRVAAGIAGALIAAGVIALILVQRAQGF